MAITDSETLPSRVPETRQDATRDTRSEHAGDVMATAAGCEQVQVTAHRFPEA